MLENEAIRDIIVFLQSAPTEIRDQVFWEMCLQVFELLNGQQLPVQSPLLKIVLSGQWPTTLREVRLCQAARRYQVEFEEVEELGRGGFGRVVRVRNKLDGWDYAVKMVETEDTSECSLEVCVSEVQTLAALDHPRVLRYITAWVQLEDWPHQATLTEIGSDLGDDCSEDSSSDNGVCVDPSSGQGDTSPDDDFVVFESTELDEAAAQPTSPRHPQTSDHSQTNTHPQRALLPFQPNAAPRHRKVLYIQMKLYGKSLRKWMDDRNSSDSPVVGAECLRIFRQVLEAMVYIHQRGYMHRDVKPANILFTLEGNDVQLGDFGLARLITHPPTTSSPGNLSRDTYTLNVGTPLYTAPEVKRGNYGKESDMYSLGIILLELFMVLKTDYERSKVITKLKEKGDLDPDWTERWPSIAEWIRLLVDKDPAKRPSAEELLNSSLFLQPEPPPFSAAAAAAVTGHDAASSLAVDAVAASIQFSRSQYASVTSMETKCVTTVESVNSSAIRIEECYSKDEEIASLKKENADLKELNDALIRRVQELELERCQTRCTAADAMQGKASED